MARPQPLGPNQYFHVYNRGINGTRIFREHRNYDYFLKLYLKYIFPVAATYAYCLMGNHFHLLVQIRKPAEDSQSSEDWQSYVSLHFRNLFSTYTKSFNKAYRRSGSLFEKPFKRKAIKTDAYFSRLVNYIHQNPLGAGFVEVISDWKYSSYNAMLSHGETRMKREYVLEWFGGRNEFVEAHEARVDTRGFEHLLFE